MHYTLRANTLLMVADRPTDPYMIASGHQEMFWHDSHILMIRSFLLYTQHPVTKTKTQTINPNMAH